MSESQKGRKFSDDQRGRMSESARDNPLKMGQNHGKARFSDDEVRSIWGRLQAGERAAEIARLLAVPKSLVSKIKMGRTWNHVTGLPRRA